MTDTRSFPRKAFDAIWPVATVRERTKLVVAVVLMFPIHLLLLVVGAIVDVVFDACAWISRKAKP